MAEEIKVRPAGNKSRFGYRGNKKRYSVFRAERNKKWSPLEEAEFKELCEKYSLEPSQFISDTDKNRKWSYALKRCERHIDRMKGSMKKFKVYMEDESGNRVLVTEFRYGELGRRLKETDLDSTALMDRMVDARNRLDKLATEEKTERVKPENLMSQYDILTKMLNYSEDEAKEMIARLKIQKLEELKLQVIAQNPVGLFCCMPEDNKKE